MMNWQAIGAVGETVGAIAVVVTLIYLARQVQEARREQQIAAIRANRDERREYFESLRDSSYLPAIHCKREAGEALTAEEALRLRFHYAATWGLLYSEWVQTRLELSGPARHAAQQRAAADERWPGCPPAPPPIARFARKAARGVWRWALLR